MPPSISLPTGWTLVHPIPADLDRLTNYQISFDTAVFGKVDTSRADIEAEWNRKGFDPARDAWFLLTPGGEIAGYSDFWHTDDELYISPMTNIHPRHREQVSPVLFYNLAQDQARTMLAEGVNQVRTISVEPPTENLLDSLGFKVTQVQWRMLYVFSEPPQQPVFPPGYHLMPFESAKYAREVFEVIETAFSELPHRRGNTFEGWKHFILDRSDFELNLLKMVVKDNEVAAVAVGFDNDLGGWVRQLAVKKVHRGKGLASCLLKQLFFEFYQHGRKDVGLVVDSENLTGAPELYRKAGMQATEKYVTFVKKVLSTTIREDKTSAYEGGI